MKKINFFLIIYILFFILFFQGSNKIYAYYSLGLGYLSPVNSTLIPIVAFSVMNTFIIMETNLEGLYSEDRAKQHFIEFRNFLKEKSATENAHPIFELNLSNFLYFSSLAIGKNAGMRFNLMPYLTIADWKISLGYNYNSVTYENSISKNYSGYLLNIITPMFKFAGLRTKSKFTFARLNKDTFPYTSILIHRFNFVSNYKIGNYNIISGFNMPMLSSNPAQLYDIDPGLTRIKAYIYLEYGFNFLNIPMSASLGIYQSDVFFSINFSRFIPFIMSSTFQLGNIFSDL